MRSPAPARIPKTKLSSQAGGVSFSPSASGLGRGGSGRPARRDGGGGERSGRSNSDRPQPLQLELFGGPGPLRPAPPAGALAQTARIDPMAQMAQMAQTVAGTAEAGPGELLRRLGRFMGARLSGLTLTDNRRTILSVRTARGDRSTPAGHVVAPRREPARAPGSFVLRIHRCFTIASEEVLQAVATFLGSPRRSEPGRQALGTIRDHFNRYRHAPAGAGGKHRPGLQAGRSRQAQSRLVPQPIGSVVDLRQLADELNQRYFEGRLKVRITWGKAAGETAHHCRRTRTSSLQLGSYSYEDRLIRIHRVLDRPGVPRYVIASIVYHELLHADLPPVVKNGRRYFHTGEFRRRERQFREFERADEWVRKNLPALLRARAEQGSARGHRVRR